MPGSAVIALVDPWMICFAAAAVFVLLPVWVRTLVVWYRVKKVHSEPTFLGVGLNRWQVPANDRAAARMKRLQKVLIIATLGGMFSVWTLGIVLTLMGKGLNCSGTVGSVGAGLADGDLRASVRLRATRGMSEGDPDVLTRWERGA